MTEETLMSSGILYKKIIQDIWESALKNTQGIYLSREVLKEEDGGAWDMFQLTLKKLPTKLELLTDTTVRDQFLALELSAEEIDNLRLSLWGYYEEHDIHVSDFSDDSMDEAEQEKDVLPFIIDGILGNHTVVHPTFIGYNWVMSDLIDQGYPGFWLDLEDRETFIKHMKEESVGKGTWNNPYYSEALRLWIESVEEDNKHTY